MSYYPNYKKILFFLKDYGISCVAEFHVLLMLYPVS